MTCEHTEVYTRPAAHTAQLMVIVCLGHCRRACEVPTDAAMANALLTTRHAPPAEAEFYRAAIGLARRRWAEEDAAQAARMAAEAPEASEPASGSTRARSAPRRAS